MRLLHTMIRVGDLDRSIAFYTGILGMKVLRRKDYPDGKFTLAFVGYGDESDHTVIELTHNWETSSYEIGNGFGHLAVAVAVDVVAVGADQGGGGRTDVPADEQDVHHPVVRGRRPAAGSVTVRWRSALRDIRGARRCR